MTPFTRLPTALATAALFLAACAASYTPTPAEQTAVSKRAASFSQAFKDGNWYLVRIDDPAHKAMLVQAYTEFQNVSVPEGTSKVIG